LVFGSSPGVFAPALLVVVTEQMTVQSDTVKNEQTRFDTRQLSLHVDCLASVQ